MEQNKTPYYLGIDIGSTTFKAVLLDEDANVIRSTYQRTRPVETGTIACTGKCNACGRCNMGALRKMAEEFLAPEGLSLEQLACTVVTGSQIVEDTKRFIPFNFQVSEVSAHVAGAQHLNPKVDAIIDCGGQDSKCMIYNEKMGMWVSLMSGVCAAGTGSYLDSVASRLGLPVEEIADRVNYDSTAEFSSVCAVLSATSVNKFKNRIPLGDLLAGACRAQARSILNGVGQLLLHHPGKVIQFQGGVASNHAVARFMEEITGSTIYVPKYHEVMGALGAAILARQFKSLQGRLMREKYAYEPTPQASAAMRVKCTRRDFLSRDKSKPLVWRNLFFPTEILHALGARIKTLETYAALFGRSVKHVKAALDAAARKGFDQQTCSFLRILEGMKHEPPAFAVSTSQPCQQGERIFADLAEEYHFEENFYSLQTPVTGTEDSLAVEQIAEGLDEAIHRMEKAMGRKMDPARLQECCQLSNEAADYSRKSNELRWTSPPLIRGAQAIYNSIIFSQLWGTKELVDIQKCYYEELLKKKEWAEKRYSIDDTHRLLWLHLPPFYNSDYLNLLEDTCNAPIVFEETNFVGWKPLDLADPIRSLARKMLASGFLNPRQRVEYVTKIAKIAKFTGCVLYTHGFGRCSMADRPFTKWLREGLEKIGLPLLTLEGDCMDASIDPCSTSTKIVSFVEALNLKKFGNLFGRVKPELPPA